jgi:hypothetical protein
MKKFKGSDVLIIIAVIPSTVVAKALESVNVINLSLISPKIYPGVSRKGGKTMKYTKPVIVAQTAKQGKFAAGCPAKDDCRGSSSTMTTGCKKCERSK